MKTKSGIIECQGRVEQCLGGGRFSVIFPNEEKLIAYAAGNMRRKHVRILPGDFVTVELTPYDKERGRITYRHKVQTPTTAVEEAPAAIAEKNGVKRPQFHKTRS